MSKAFTKEDVDPPERSGRVRSASGLPPGATNYITPGGAAWLQGELARLRSAGGNRQERIAEIEGILKSVTVIESPEDPGSEVRFGARVTVRDATNELKTYRIVGVDELHLEPDAVSWISPLGRTLLAAKHGERVTSEETGPVKIVKIEYPVYSN
jgi:transcription elongation GreA/GreB family factor